jgi:hypothetical protein
MIKVKFETKQDYIDYCIKEEILNFSRKYGSTHVFIDDAIKCKNCISGKLENTYIDKEPLRYPCIFQYYVDAEGNIYGGFVYQNDF